MPNRMTRLYGLSLFLTCGVLFLLMAGGLVTSHQAGLAVPDWPLSYGRFFPPMVGNIFWEHGHRMIAGAVALLTVLNAVLIQKYEPRTGIRRLAWAGVVMVFTQALLGGLTVLLLLPPAVSIAHACLGQTFFCLVIALTYYQSPFAETENPADPPEAPRIRRLARLTFIFLYLQLILGATVRHTSLGVPYHVIGAFLVVVHVLLLSSRLLHAGRWYEHLSRPALLMAAMTLLQVFLGIGSFIFKFMVRQGYQPSLGRVAFTAAHQTLGAVILGTAALILVAVFPVPRSMRLAAKAAA